MRLNLSSISISIRRNSANISLYLLASLIPMGLNILINPLVALNMGPKDFSIVGVYASFSNLLSPLISFYAFGYYSKRFYEVNDEHSRLLLKSTIFKSLIFISFVLSLVSLFGVFSYMKFLNTESDISFFPYALLSILAIPLNGIYTLKLVDLKMAKKVNLYFNYSVIYGLLSVGFTLLLVVFFKLGAFGKLSTSMLLSALMFIFLIIKEKKLLSLKFDRQELKNMIGFVWPLILGAMLHFFTKGFDIVYLERLNDSNELGYYVVAFQIVGYIGLFHSSVGNTFQPDIYKAMIDRHYVRAAKYMALTFTLLAIIVLVFYVFAPFVINILTAGKYNESAGYARILSISQLMMSIYYITTELFIINGQTRCALISKCIGVVITIMMYSYVISEWQYMGAAWGASISFLILTLINVMFLYHKRSILFREASKVNL